MLNGYMVIKVVLKSYLMIQKRVKKRMDIKRTIIICDVHGCLIDFNILLDKLNYNSKEDRVILLGDLIDRGPDSIGVLHLARQLNLECVMGNHEHKFLKWYKAFGTKVDVY